MLKMLLTQRPGAVTLEIRLPGGYQQFISDGASSLSLPKIVSVSFKFKTVVSNFANRESYLAVAAVQLLTFIDKHKN